MSGHHASKGQCIASAADDETQVLAQMNERGQTEEVLLKAGALQRAILNSANFSSIATDARGVLQVFNVGAERMLGYTADEVVNKTTPADLSDRHELIARAAALTLEFETQITPALGLWGLKARGGFGTTSGW